MASLDLTDLIPDLQYNLNSPGEDAFANVSEEEWTSRLRDGFWNAWNDGLIQDYIEVDGVVSPRSGTATISRDQQQIILLYTSIAVLFQQMLRLNTTFRAKAGPVEYETQQSAQLLKALLDDLSQRRIYLLERLAETGVTRAFYLIDTYQSRQSALNEGISVWVGN